MNNKNTHQVSIDNNKIWVKRMLGLLALQFTFGMIINLYSPPNGQNVPKIEQAILNIFLGLHILTALLIVFLMIFIVKLSKKLENRKFKKTALHALFGVIAAVIGGIITMTAPDSVQPSGSFLMALGFLGTFFFTGKYFILLKQP